MTTLQNTNNVILQNGIKDKLDNKPLINIQKRRALRPTENVNNINTKILNKYQNNKDDVIKLNDSKPMKEVKPKRNLKVAQLRVPNVISNNGKPIKTINNLLSHRKYKLSAKKLNIKKLKHTSKDNSKLSNVPKNSQSSSSNYTTISSDDQDDNYADALSNISQNKSKVNMGLKESRIPLKNVTLKVNQAITSNKFKFKRDTNLKVSQKLNKKNEILPDVIEPKLPIDISPIKAFSSLSLKEILYDVDSIDNKDEIAYSLYARDVFDYMYALERSNVLKENYISSPSITTNMRLILVDWIMQIHQHFKLIPETLYLTISLIDRYLQKVKDLPKKNVQLLGVSAMFIACKFEELYILEAKDFVYVTKDTYSVQDILNMEIDILKCIDFNFRYPYPIHFLRRFTKIAQVSLEEHTLSKFLIELTLLDSNLLGHYPSKIAAAALCLSMSIFYCFFDKFKEPNGTDEDHKETQADSSCQWNKALQYHSKYDKNDLDPLVSYYVKTFKKLCATPQYKTVISKYSSPKLGNVAAILKDYCSLMT